jgi:hypothetical protein
MQASLEVYDFSCGTDRTLLSDSPLGPSECELSVQMQCCQVDLPSSLFNGLNKSFDGYFVDSHYRLADKLSESGGSMNPNFVSTMVSTEANVREFAP